MRDPFPQQLSENEESSEEGASGSEDLDVQVFPIDFDNVGGAEDDEVPSHIAASQQLERQRVAALLDQDD